MAARRRRLQHTGWVDGEEIRCAYHGWQFDSASTCEPPVALARPHPAWRANRGTACLRGSAQPDRAEYITLAMQPTQGMP